VGGSCSILTRLFAATVLLTATSAHAQHPVCAPLAPGEAVHAVCAPFSLYAAVRLTADFTVDHLFKPSPPTIQRSVLEASQHFAAKQIADNPALKSFLAALVPLRFSQLDRTTGTVQADFSTNPREFEGRLAGVEGEPTLALRLPATLQGGYWRAPDVLQIAFWEQGRVAIRTDHGGGRVVEGEVECVALSPNYLLARFAPATTPPLLVRFRECDQ